MFQLKALLNQIITDIEVNILITGITGFLGEGLVNNFLKKNEFKIFGVYRNKQKINKGFLKSKNFFPIPKKIEELNISDLNNIDFLLHLAGPAANSSNLDALTISQSIINPTTHLLKLIKSTKTKINFIYFSSGAVYGSNFKNEGFEEKTSVIQLNELKDLYSSSKIMSESLCAFFSEFFPVTILRLFSFSGPNMKYNFPYALSEFISLSSKNEDIYIENPNNVLRSYLHTDDLFKNLLKLILKLDSQKKSKGLNIFNIGSKNPISIKNLVNMVVEESASKSNIILNESEIKSIRNKYYPNITKLENFIDYEEMSIKDNIIDTINNFKYES